MSKFSQTYIFRVDQKIYYKITKTGYKERVGKTLGDYERYYFVRIVSYRFKYS